MLTLTQVGQPALKAGCTYTLRFGIIYYVDTAATNLVVNALAGNTVIASYTTAGKSGQNIDAGIQTFSVTPNVTGAVSFRFVFGAAGGTNDLTLYSPSMTCV